MGATDSLAADRPEGTEVGEAEVEGTCGRHEKNQEESTSLLTT
jgi:hypothetical protein